VRPYVQSPVTLKTYTDVYSRFIHVVTNLERTQIQGCPVWTPKIEVSSLGQNESICETTWGFFSLQSFWIQNYQKEVI
jgi:hypothetical protein